VEDSATQLERIHTDFRTVRNETVWRPGEVEMKKHFGFALILLLRFAGRAHGQTSAPLKAASKNPHAKRARPLDHSAVTEGKAALR